MNVTEVLEIEGSTPQSKPLVAGEKLVVQKFEVKNVEKVGAECAELSTTEGTRYTFAKAIVGQAKSPFWLGACKKCVDKDASDGLDVWVVEKVSNTSGRPMLSLTMYEPNSTKA